MDKRIVKTGGGGGKKLFLSFFMFAFAAWGAFAQFEGGTFGLGARGFGLLPFYEAGADYIVPSTVESEFKGKFTGGFALQASYNFTDLLGVQLEGVFSMDEFDIETAVPAMNMSGKTTVRTATLHIPVLLKVGSVLYNGMYLGGIGGVYFTIPVMDCVFTSEGSISGYGLVSGTGMAKWEGSMGVTVGGVVGYILGYGMLFADVRYSADFSDSKLTEGGMSAKFFKKSGIEIGVGYAWSFDAY
jgi:hypothetical protein